MCTLAFMCLCVCERDGECVSECMRMCVCVDGLSGRLGPGGITLVNNSDEAHYQGSADFSLISP